MPLIQSARTASDLVSAILLIYFVHSAIGSIVQHQTAINVLAFYTPADAPREFIAWGISGWQAITAALLFFPATRVYGFVVSLVYFLGLSLLAWQYPGAPAKFGGLLNHISRFHTQLLALTGIGLTAIGLLFRYLPRILSKRQVIAQ